MIAVSILLGATAAAAGPGPAFLARDAVGDSGAAPDIVTGSAQQADSLATTLLFRVELGNRTALGVDDGVVFGIDSDANDTTGAGGKDYAIFLFSGGLARLARFGASEYALVPSPSLQAVEAFGVSIARSELGNPEKLEVSFLTIGPGEAADDTGDLPFFVLYPACANKEDDDKDGMTDSADPGCASTEDENEADDPVTLRVTRVVIAPHLRAGAAVSASALVTRVETGKTIDSGTAKCNVRSVGGAALRTTTSLAAGRATCRFRVPEAMKGKRLAGSITVTHRGQRIVAPFAGLVA